MTDLNQLVVSLKTDIESNVIYTNMLKNGEKWINIKKKEFKENKDKIIDDIYLLSYVENKDIPFKALRLTLDDLTLRNDIYTELYINNNINENTIMKFIENIYLFFDITEENEIKTIIHELLFIKEDNDISREVLERIKVKMMAFNNIRKSFNPDLFVRNCYKEHGQPYKDKQNELNRIEQNAESIRRNTKKFMAIREHGQPYKRGCITEMVIREHGQPYSRNNCNIN